MGASTLSDSKTVAITDLARPSLHCFSLYQSVGVTRPWPRSMSLIWVLSIIASALHHSWHHHAIPLVLSCAPHHHPDISSANLVLFGYLLLLLVAAMKHHVVLFTNWSCEVTPYWFRCCSCAPSAPTPPYPKQQEDGLATNIHRIQKHHDHGQARCEPPLKILGQY